jgi:hypothetical protein
VVDAYGNLVTGGSTQVALAVSGPGSFTASSTTAPSVNGVATFFLLTFTTPGSYTLTASAPNLASVNSVPLTVTAGNPSRLVWMGTPSGTTAGQTLAPVTVEVFDAYGNPVINSNMQVTVASSVPGTLSGSTSAPVVNGFATFPALALTQAGTFTLTASLAGQASVTTAPFPVSAASSSGGGGTKPTTAVVAKLHFLSVPSKATVGHSLGTVRVQLLDSHGRPVKVRQSVSLRLLHGRLKGTITVRTDANGIATFTGLSITTVGRCTLVAAAKGVKATVSQVITVAAVTHTGRFR